MKLHTLTELHTVTTQHFIYSTLFCAISEQHSEDRNSSCYTELLFVAVRITTDCTTDPWQVCHMSPMVCELKERNFGIISITNFSVQPKIPKTHLSEYLALHNTLNSFSGAFVFICLN